MRQLLTLPGYCQAAPAVPVIIQPPVSSDVKDELTVAHREVINTDANSVANGCLADVAPTILKLMGIPQPDANTGKTLI